MIIKPRLCVVITCQRHGSTTFCHHASSIPKIFSGYELFRNKQWYSIKTKNQLTYSNYLYDRINTFKAIEYQNDVVFLFKIFLNDVNLDYLLNVDYDICILFLRRNLSDAYDSWYKAVTTGNWGTCPALQQQFEQKAPESRQYGYMIKDPNKIMTREQYITEKQEWFDYALSMVTKYQLSHKEIKFDDIIKAKVDYNKLYTEILSHFR